MFNSWFRASVQRLCFGALLAGLLAPAPARAAFQDPPTFASKNGRLAILMIAAKRPHVTIGATTTDLWTYEVCPLPAPGAGACPAGTGQSGLGGVRLALQPGDTLTIRLVNKLPPLAPEDADHIADHASLAGNPTNLHTHGLIVEPHKSVGPADPYGDYVFLEIRNGKNPIPPGEPHPGIDVAKDAAEYLYTIDKTHPPGLFWFHPHLHGLSLNQVSAGMAGILTIGDASDDCDNLLCTAALNAGAVRHLVLKDTQVGPGGALKTQEEPNFCTGAPAGSRLGACDGQLVDPSDPGSDFRGGKWLHTVSGQLYPTIDVGPNGDVWRIVNASGSRSYALSLAASSGAKLPLQLLAIDGVTLNVGAGIGLPQLTTLLARKVTLARCPGQLIAGLGGRVCASTINMMPSSRIDVRVVSGDLAGPTQPAILRTAEYPTGDDGNGDLWPQIDLAAVNLAPRGLLTLPSVPTRDVTALLFSGLGQFLAPAKLRLPGTTTSVPASRAGAAIAVPPAGPAIQDVTPAATAAITQAQMTGQAKVANCAPLAPGHHRKILFGYPTPTTFGLGYVEVDQSGRDIEATRLAIAPFNPAAPVICIPLPGGNAVNELWELQNTTNEDHNFHIHQTRFFVVDGGVLPGQTIPQMLGGNVVMHDNVPVPRPANAAQCDGTIGPVTAGQCRPSRTFVVIPFNEIGDFVFHCHILEHEDGGMMARIRVVASE